MKDHVKASQASFEKLVKYCECDSRSVFSTTRCLLGFDFSSSDVDTK